MRIVTWNINSVRLRIELLAKMAKKLKPDIICLQETKCPNDSFPTKAINKMGFEHIATNGIKGYHGVATLSKIPFAKTNIIDYCGQKDGRHIETVLEYEGAPLSLHNFYVPAGGDEPDRKINEKFDHKLDFLGEMESRFVKAKQKTIAQRILVGDLNIAPYEHDVWSHKQLLNVVSHT
ncbi:MAG: exodeoxyribonuclease III, partial [Pseudomonadota bacterium]|nr:exodeoxyribonuclease III [Pseudomonadota bacterium]